MNQVLHYVITNSGDGSNGTHWVADPAVLDRMEQLVDDGDERYTSGDGLQANKLVFPSGFDLAAWMKVNYIDLTTLEDLE